MHAWSSLKNKTSYEHIIAILKKSGGTKDKIQTYGRPVFEECPEIGLKLFINNAKDNKNMHDNADFNDSYDSISMVPDEIIDFLKSIEDDHQP